jgi:hypothetical protein
MARKNSSEIVRATKLIREAKGLRSKLQKLILEAEAQRERLKKNAVRQPARTK